MPFGANASRRLAARSPAGASGLVIQHGRRELRGKNGSSLLPGSRTLRCKGSRDGEIRANPFLRNVPTLVPVSVPRNPQRLPYLCLAIEAVDPLSLALSADAIPGGKGHSLAGISAELPVANKATVQAHFNPLFVFRCP